MVEGLTTLINAQGWLAPLWYVAGFLLAALVPIVPTPLIAAIGGTAFGAVPAALYGVIGLALGTATSLAIARQLGRRAMRRLVPDRTWKAWEALLGVESLLTWYVIFFFMNLDVAVMAAGLTSLRARPLWWTAMAARLPWVVLAAWIGDAVVVNDAALILMALLMIPVLMGLRRLQERFRRWLTERVASDVVERR